ncbi:MAG: HAMP domain-containing histidine kinase [Clostridia bacterium]|nr:HAMP domain-containing histidine kinase [Clostridia bacterium]
MAEHEIKRKKARRERRGIGIQWRLLGYLSAFIAFMLAVLWIFQVQMLNRFYENTKDKELSMTATALIGVLGDEQATQDMVYRCAIDYSLCIRVFRVENRLARDIAAADVSSDCVIHHVMGEYLSELYRYAKQNGGTYTGKVQFQSGGMEWIDGDMRAHTDEQTTDDNTSRRGRSGARNLQSGDVSALYIQIVKAKDGNEYIVMLDAVLTPMSATVSTLKTQFWWIACILLVGALVLAYLMSRRISRPLVRMNEAAKQLAQGHYDAHFSGNGYRETRELAKTLNYASDELSRADRLQKELIANVSHDLRTPLTMIRGYGEVIRDVPGENTPENVQVIIDETDHLSSLVSDMLDLSKMQAGTRAPSPEHFDLTEAIRTVMARYEKLTQHDGYVITFCADESALVYADRTMMLQVVYNLINNAINYAGEDRRVEVTQMIDAGRVRICVRDFGAGIEPDQLPLIWDRYYKVDRVHRRAMIGTGLGLSIAKGVLELHGADYGVRSTHGSGSEFWFELDVARKTFENNDTSTEENDDGDMDGTSVL